MIIFPSYSVPILPRFLLEIEEAKIALEKSVVAVESHPVTMNSSIESSNSSSSLLPSGTTLAPEHFHNGSSTNGTTFKAGCFDSSDSAENRYKALKGESTYFGVLLASKSFVQLLINPFVGWFASR